ncbi:polysaccharide lyase family 7 protein [Burkholderia plantarii]|uniref:polysaccharide lyase family 7 protein n=1 Tax=Burkholderia plantarii TaxID=41899 RepID=UPI0006D8BDE9|nr:polysaccharide lyase family 7 protein [Burkholderia plantarii]ALK34842.1 alginate lyase [Burkholderia plantarii]GLZ18714.1 alginate lyase [Burkholderia plantarii]
MQGKIVNGALAALCAGLFAAHAVAGQSAEILADDAAVVAAAILDPSAPPGSNFNLKPWTLQLPIGASGSVTQVNGDSLAAGYTNQYYFHTDKSDGAMVMMDPTRGWTTSGSQHPRTELRENAIWPTSGANRLDATLIVVQVPKTTTIGQIFQGNGPSKPLCELQVTSGGNVQLLLEDTNQGGASHTYPIAGVTIGKSFTYELSLSGTTIGVKVNGTSKSFTMDSSFDGESFYFKAGNYDQSATSGTPLTTPGTVVKFYALTLTHG